MHDPESTLKPLRAVEGDVIALRTGQGGAAAVVRIARAAETVLRRMRVTANALPDASTKLMVTPAATAARIPEQCSCSASR